MEQRNFYEAKSHLYEFYGIDMDDDQFETVALHAWDKINNKAFRFYKWNGQIKNHKLKLPCNADIIEYVQGAGESIGTSSVNPYTSGAMQYSSNMEEMIEDGKGNQSAYYGRGHYLQYTRLGDTLEFPNESGHVTILYKGIVADEEGLPMLNYKEVEAIAKYCAFVDNQKRAMITKDQATMQLAQMMRQEWLMACADARTPIYITQNEMDTILNAQASWDRKRYNISFKTMR